jgi:hypothetical protein
MQKTARRGALRSVLITKYYLGDQITQNEMSWASGTYGKEGKYVWSFGG